MSRRVTFMVGFWEKIHSETRSIDCPGPGQPYPTRHPSLIHKNSSEATTGKIFAQLLITMLNFILEEAETSKYTWSLEMQSVLIPVEECNPVADDDWLEPTVLPAIWEPVDGVETGNGEVSKAFTPYAARYEDCFQGF